MFVGHFAPALALRAASDRAPLWLLVLGTQAVDVLFFLLVFAGVESADVRPGEHPQLEVTMGIWTHSLVMTAGYAALCLGAGRLLRKPMAGILLAVAVASHWFADLVVHVPDLPITWEQTTAVGFGLWRVPHAAMVLEVVLVAVGAAALHWASKKHPAMRRRLLMFAAGLIVLQLVSELLVPTPPDDVALGGPALAVYALATGVAFWVERPALKANPVAPEPATTSGPGRG